MPLDWTPLKRGDMVAGHRVEFVRRFKGPKNPQSLFATEQVHKFRFRDPEGRLWWYVHVGPRIRALVEPEVAEDYPIILANASPEVLARATELSRTA